jgi:carbamoyltransferase
MTAILGISAFYHDSAAALIVDGRIVAAAQQERYSRLKHDPRFPKEAIEFVLSEANLNIEDLNGVVFYDKPLLKFERLLETFLANAPRGFRAFARAMPIWLKEKLYLKSLLRRELRHMIISREAAAQHISFAAAKKSLGKITLAQLYFCEHHQSHAAAAYFPSPFDEAAVVCLDGVGEWATSSIWHGKGKELSPISELQFPHSLGLLYSAFTYFCGFKVNSGEYKLMGLAPYGKPKYAHLIKKHLIDIRDDGSFTLDMRYFNFARGATMTNTKFEKLFGVKALAFDAELGQVQMDLASSIQAVTEEIVLKIVARAKQETGCKNLCLAGGVALNCVANGKVLQSGLFDDIWIQPAAGDAGSAIGAALQVWYQGFDGEKTPVGLASKELDHMQGAYLGDAYSNEQVKAVCEANALPYCEFLDDQLYAHVSEALAQDKVVGWFQGKMEFGPRALGNRSILGDPRSSNMQRQMNVKIKQRESFRPFAPAVLAEDVNEWFELQTKSPYMLLVAKVKEEHCTNTLNKNTNKAREGLDKVNEVRSSVPAITHVDFSARVQTVHPQSNERFHALIRAFKQKTGVGMLINTSFNVRGEPPVRSPEDAIRGFLATEMDMLVMENMVLIKEQQPQAAIDSAKRVSFAKD